MKILGSLATLVLVALIGAGAIFAWGSHAYKQPGPLAETKIILIEKGSSVRAIAGILRREDVLAGESFYVFLAAARLTGAKLQAGEYEFTPAITIAGVIGLLESGKIYQRQVTFAEGLTSAEIVERLRQMPDLSGDVTDMPPDGSLLPETYNYSYDTPRADIISRMQKSMKDTIEVLWAGRAEGLPLATPEEAVILASIVEKETGVAAERPRVAGVFINRLKAGMPLQSDPTVIYALTEGKTKLDRALTRGDLSVSSPYNTYQVNGLPPGPIANPGRESIAAVLNPEVHDFLYFVADGTGGHAFAPTLAEHNRNVGKWREVQKKDR